MDNNNATPIEALFVKAEDYSKTTFELFKLYAIDKSADLISFLAMQLAILIVVALVAITTSIGLALWLGEVTGKTYYGFFIVGGLYILITALLFAFRDQWVKTPVANTVISYILKKKMV